VPVSHRRKLSLLAAFGAGAIVGALALVLVPASDHRVGPAIMSAKTRLGGAHTVLVVPPLGTVRAPTHPVPVSLEVSLAELDITRLQEIVRDPQAEREVRATVEEDLRRAAIGVAIRTILAALVGGALAGLILPSRKPADIASAAGGGLLLGVAVVSTVALTYDVNAFQEPSYSGALTRAPAVLRTLEQQNLSLAAVDSRFDTAADRLSELLELMASPAQNPREDTVALLHVSDIHSNPLGVSVARQLARTFDVDAVIDSGDLTSFGEAVEANVARRVSDMDVPYIFVPGNHDSLAVQERLDRIDNVHLLHNDTFDVEGITVFGWRDPTFTVWDAISTEEGNELRTEEGDEIAAALEDTPDVDVLVVHDRRMGEASEGLVPLVLSGHTHERDIVEGEETDFLTVGSTGATGLEFFVEGSRPYEAEIIYFRDGEAVAVDYVIFEGLGEEFEVDRKRLGS
jgi:predicted phosphodiesterase